MRWLPSAALVQRRFDIVSWNGFYRAFDAVVKANRPESQRSRGRCPKYEGNLRRGSLGRFLGSHQSGARAIAGTRPALITGFIIVKMLYIGSGGMVPIKGRHALISDKTESTGLGFRTLESCSWTM